MKLATLALTFVLSSLAGVAGASEIRPYTDDGFKAAQSAGGPILIDVTASWCPTCRAQKPTVEALATEADNGLVVFAVDFDAQKDVVRAFRAQRQSTLIAFRGTTETGRSVGVTDPAAIRDLVATAY